MTPLEEKRRRSEKSSEARLSPHKEKRVEVGLAAALGEVDEGRPLVMFATRA